MQARLIGPDERARFDRFVAGHPQGNLLQSWAWGEIRSRQRWLPVRLLVEDGGGRPRASASALIRRLPLGGSVLYLPRGPVLDWRDREAADTLVSALRRLGRSVHAVFVKVDPYVTPPDPEVLHALRRHGFRVGHRRGRFDGMQPRFCCLLPLDGGADAVLARLHPKTRYNIRLSDRRGVEVARRGREALPAFHRLLMETCARDGFRERDCGYFQQVWDGLDPEGHIALFVARAAGRDLAAAIVTVFGGRAVYAYGASAGERRNLMAPYAVQWAAIQYALACGCTTYDLTGVPRRLVPGAPGYGLWRFKRGFAGDRPAEFVGEFDLPLRPVAWRAWNVVEPVYWGSRLLLQRVSERGRGTGLLGTGPLPSGVRQRLAGGE